MNEDNRMTIVGTLEAEAITKLQDYVARCGDMERAKKICRAFLAKFDSPTPSEMGWEGSQKYLSSRDSKDDYVYWTMEKMDQYVHIHNMTPFEKQKAKNEIIFNGIKQITSSIFYDERYKLVEGIDARTFEHTVKIGLGVFKL